MTEKTDEEKCTFCGGKLTEIGSKKPCCFLRRVMDNFTGEFCTFDMIIDEYESTLEAERKKHEAEIKNLYSKLRKYKRLLQEKIKREQRISSVLGEGVCFANVSFNDVFYEERKRIMSIE